MVPSLLILASSACKSFQCLISALTQGGRGTRQASITGVCVVLTVSGPHWVCPAHGSVCFPGLHCSGSRLLCRGAVQSGPWVACPSQVWDAQVQGLGCSRKAQTRRGPRSVPFPGARSSGKQVLGEHTVPGGQWVLITSPVPAARFPEWAARAPSQVSPLGSSSQAATLLADVNRPGSQGDLVSKLEPAHSSVEGAVTRAEIAPCLLPPVGGGAGLQPASSPFVFAQSFVPWVGQAVR